MLKGHQNCVSIQSFKRYIFWVVWPLRDMDKAYRKADQSYNLRSTTTNSAWQSSGRCYGATGSASGKEWCRKSFRTLDPHHQIQAAVPRELPLTCGRADGPLSIPLLNFSMAEHLYWCCLSNSVVLTLNIASAPSSCCTHHSMSATLCQNLKGSLLSFTSFCCSSTLCPSDPATCFWTQSSSFYFILSVPSLQWRT